MKFPLIDAHGLNKETFEKLCIWAHEQKASDILIITNEPICVIKDDVVEEVTKARAQYSEIENLLRKIYLDSAPALLMSGKDLPFSVDVLNDRDEVIRFRVMVTACRGAITDKEGVEIVMRTIDDEPPDAETLGLEQELLDLGTHKSGILIVSGSTGSGKTTLIGSWIKWVAQNFRKHIITYEDPIEFDLQNLKNKLSKIIQTDVSQHLKGYAKAIPNVLRRAPHIIFMGEARDRVSIEETIRAAKTGHFVVTTTHTNSVANTVTRMADEFPGNEYRGTCSKIIDSLAGIVHQRLVKRRGGGRVALREYLLFTDEIKRQLFLDLLNVDDITPSIQKQLEMHGITLLESAKQVFKRGDLEMTDFLMLISELGSPKDIEPLEGWITEMHRNSIIDEDTRSQWLEMLSIQSQEDK